MSNAEPEDPFYLGKCVAMQGAPLGTGPAAQKCQKIKDDPGFGSVRSHYTISLTFGHSSMDYCVFGHRLGCAARRLDQRIDIQIHQEGCTTKTSALENVFLIVFADSSADWVMALGSAEWVRNPWGRLRWQTT